MNLVLDGSLVSPTSLVHPLHPIKTGQCVSYDDISSVPHTTYVIQIKICAEYRDMLPRPRLVCQEPGLRSIGLSPGVADKSRRSHECKSLPNRFTSDKKSLFTVTNVLSYIVHAILCHEHTDLLRSIIERSFAIVAKSSLFWLSIVTWLQLICDVMRTRDTGIVTSYSSILIARSNWRKRRSSLVNNSSRDIPPRGNHGNACKIIIFCIISGIG